MKPNKSPARPAPPWPHADSPPKSGLALLAGLPRATVRPLPSRDVDHPRKSATQGSPAFRKAGLQCGAVTVTHHRNAGVSDQRSSLRSLKQTAGPTPADISSPVTSRVPRGSLHPSKVTTGNTGGHGARGSEDQAVCSPLPFDQRRTGSIDSRSAKTVIGIDLNAGVRERGSDARGTRTLHSG